MNTKLTGQQIESYRMNGFVVHRELFTADQTEELKSAALAAIATMDSRYRVAKGGALIEQGDAYYQKVFTQCMNLWRISDTVKRYMLNPSIGQMLCELEEVDGFRVWHDQMLIEEPYGNPTAWHLDNPYFSFNSRQVVSIWIALEPATLENGCMWFVPGSPPLARFQNVGISENLAELFSVYPEMTKIDPVAVPMQPGDCSFHNGLTAHGAGANMTRQRRIAITCAYMPAGSTFNGKQNILPPDYFASLAVGDELANDDWNPLMGSRK